MSLSNKKTTLFMRIKNTESNDTATSSLYYNTKNKHASWQIFDDLEEEALKSYAREAGKLNFGLTVIAIRQLAYQLAVSLNKTIPLA